jgi:hypothetical protein
MADDFRRIIPLKRTAASSCDLGELITKPLKPGSKAPTSGQYEIISQGRRTGVERTATKRRAPAAAPRSGDGYTPADGTKHRKYPLERSAWRC